MTPYRYFRVDNARKPAGGLVTSTKTRVISMKQSNHPPEAQGKPMQAEPYVLEPPRNPRKVRSRVQILPSILAADFSDIAKEIHMVESAGADALHLDSMDGQFVPNLSWGPKIVGDLRKVTTLRFDCHLMIAEPERYVDEFRKAGADVITFHYEATRRAHWLLQHVREIGGRAGLAINPQTPTAMLVDLVEDCDQILVMSVEPGFGGQAFIEHALIKVRQVREMVDARNPGCDIEVDGGLGAENIERAVAAGATMLVAGSSIFNADDPSAALRDMRSRIDSVPY
jgi:ribulose-phosphate 3-epimerase